jgi:hypothetical protein
MERTYRLHFIVSVIALLLVSTSVFATEWNPGGWDFSAERRNEEKELREAEATEANGGKVDRERMYERWRRKRQLVIMNVFYKNKGGYCVSAENMMAENRKWYIKTGARDFYKAALPTDMYRKFCLELK